MINKKFGKLTVIEECEERQRRYKCYKCKCECGNTVIVRGDNLRNGHTKTCGCNKYKNLIYDIKHGKTDTRLYSIWNGMKSRCYNKNNKSYKHYGTRGITICDEWLYDFQTFYDWAMSHNYSDDLTIDRIDNDGNYEPSNCRWADWITQNNNRSNNKH